MSKTKFVLIFLASAFVFQFATSSIIGPDTRLFPAGHSEAFLGLGNTGWRHAVSLLFLPIKAVLIGPLIPFINFLRQEPDTPPPFFLIGFAFYWTLLALGIYHFIGKYRHAKV